MRGSILVVEDEQPIREMLRSVLELEGFSVVTASNGLEGLEVLRSLAEPTLILLDMMMPKASGWYFLDIVRASPDLARVPVVIISAYSEIAKSVSAQAVVPKPIQLKTLLAAIEKHVAA